MAPEPSDYLKPHELVAELIDVGEKKAALPVFDMILRGFMSAVILGFATSLTVTVVAQGMPSFVGALLFPVGFVILVLLGFELVTGNFALLPTAYFAGRITLARMLRSWAWVFLGNLLGGLFYALLFYCAVTRFGAEAGGAVAETTAKIAEKKVLGYALHGASGWATAFVRAVLCNCMVTLGTVMSFVSRSVVGKISAMWLPILTFYALALEHSVVNMYAIPAGMLFGAKVSLVDWWLNNQVPVTLGNIVGGALLTGASLYLCYGRQHRAAVTSSGASPAGSAEPPPVQVSSVPNPS